MHYGKYDFAINPKIWTIRPKAPNQDKPIGVTENLSAIDVTKINSMYPKKNNGRIYRTYRQHVKKIMGNDDKISF